MKGMEAMQLKLRREQCFVDLPGVFRGPAFVPDVMVSRESDFVAWEVGKEFEKFIEFLSILCQVANEEEAITRVFTDMCSQGPGAAVPFPGAAKVQVTCNVKLKR